MPRGLPRGFFTERRGDESSDHLGALEHGPALNPLVAFEVGEGGAREPVRSALPAILGRLVAHQLHDLRVDAFGTKESVKADHLVGAVLRILRDDGHSVVGAAAPLVRHWRGIHRCNE